jgi:phage tail-like protein
MAGFDANFSAGVSASASVSLNVGIGGQGGEEPPLNIPENRLAPLHVFRFEVVFRKHSLGGNPSGSTVALCSGAFAECTGLEATMEPKVIKAGGLNYGPAQRVGQVSFATVVLKRGMTQTRDLWKWFELVAGGSYAYRLAAEIAMQDTAGKTVLTWGLARALPVKFKAADLNAKGAEVGIEELHLAHEGLTLLGSP